jgi:hypothetical protein
MQNRNPIEVNIHIVTIAEESKFNRAAKSSGLLRRHSPGGCLPLRGTSV